MIEIMLTILICLISIVISGFVFFVFGAIAYNVYKEIRKDKNLY